MRWLLGFLTVVGLSAQPIEISAMRDAAPLAGVWKIKQGDDPRWASPQFDDSSWEAVQMPRHAASHPGGFFWMRFSFRLPDPLPDEPLFLLIGPQFSAYDVFVNGQRAGHFGGTLGELSGLYVTRPQEFPLPRGAEVHVAVRVYNGWLFFGRPSYSAPRTQSFVATRAGVDGIVARFEADRAAQTFMPRMLFLILTIGGLLFVALYFTRRSNPEYLWCGLIFLTTMGNRLVQFVPEFYGGNRMATVLSAFVTDAVFPFAWVLFPLRLLRLRPNGLDWILLGVYLATNVQYLPQIASGPLWDSARVIRILLMGVAYASAVMRAGAARSTAERLWSIHAALGIFWVLNASFFILSTVRGYSFGDEYSASDVLLRSPVVLLIFAMGVLMFQRSARQDREEGRMRQELAAAAHIQELLLSNQTAPGVTAVYLPAAEVGGDFYYVRRDEEGFVVAVGDVSGKGLKAAMLASVLIGALRREESASPARILSELNRVLLPQAGIGFVTCCCARFDRAGAALVATAGHPAPFVDGREAEIAPGLPLGVSADAVYSETRLAGEQFTFLSDGVVEAENTQRELFGFDRARQISTRSAQEIADAARAWGQNDDITVLTIRRADGK